jgi:ankyrin repeat protein
MEDPYWYDMAGRDIIRQRHIFDRFEGGEQKEKLGEVLKEFPKKGGKIMEKAAKEGFPGAMINFLELGIRPFGKVHDVDSKVESEGEVIEEEQKEGEDEDENADFVKYKIEDEDGNKVFWSLHLAAHSGQLECVQILVEKGNLDVDTLDDLITTPLINAVVQGNFEVSQWLLEKGADPEFKRRNEEGGLSILQAAAKTGKPELLKVILAHRNSNEDLVNLEHRLHVCAAMSGNMEMLKLVLEKTGFPVDDDNTKGWKGASLKEKQRDEVELTLGALNKESSVDFIGLLLSYLTPRNEDGSFQPHKLKDEGREISVLNGLEDSIHHTNLFDLLWGTLLAPSQSDLDSDPEAEARHREWLNRRLISACTQRSLETVKLILGKYKGNPNHISIKYHTTPLFLASALGDVDLVQYLLDNHHVDINIGCGTFANGPTALQSSQRDNAETRWSCSTNARVWS